MTSLYSGASGLEANSTELSVIGDNIANANTIGFKEGRAAFEDALAQNLIAPSSQEGLGTKLQAIQRLETQGALTNTGLATDLAIQGNGLFVVQGAHAGQVGTFYTRAGQFTLNADGYLVNLEGLRVQGSTANAAGALQPGIGDLQVGESTAPPQPTANLSVRANLQADAAIPAAWDANNAATTSNFSTSSTAYDSLGVAHQVSLYYRHSGSGTWEWHGLTDGGGITGGTPGTPFEIAGGTLTFDASGKLTDTTQSSNFNPVDALAQPLTFSFGTGTNAGGTGLDGITQFSGASAVTFVSQDGFGAGDLSSIAINTQGQVMGAFSNGQSRLLGQVAVADFGAPDKLTRIGGNLYQQTPDSGAPALGAPGQGGRGSLVAGALEQSNVDIATEFVRMIAAQRGFEANSKTLTTADQLLSELIAIKR